MIKQMVKAALPGPVIHGVIGVRDWLSFAATSQRAFRPGNLAPSDSISLAEVYANPAVRSAWEEDAPGITSVFGNDDNSGGVNPGDRRALYSLVMSLKPKAVLEVGTHIGASTIHIALALKRIGEDGRVLSADLIDVNHPQEGSWKKVGMAKSPRDFMNDLKCADRVDFHVGPCMDFMTTTDRKFDLIFLDGDHKASAVYQELSAALGLLNENGVVLLHDYYPGAQPLYPKDSVIRGPYRAVERARRENAAIDVLPLGELPWPTKQGVHATSLALVTRKA